MVWTQHCSRRYQVRDHTRDLLHVSDERPVPRALVHSFPKAGLGVSVASDSVIYQSDVYAASHNPTESPKRRAGKSWGNRGVLVLIGTRLGIDGVNPVYYEAIKASYLRRGPGSAFLTPSSGVVHLAPVSRNRRWSSIFFVLLRWLSSRQPLLPGPASRPTHCSAANPTRRA